MIPRIIHYCWFGEMPIPEQDVHYIETWHLHMPDYDYKLWNENTFDISSAPLYVKEAYAAKKYAFVSDYVRLWALYQHGGIYFDTDVEVLRPFDDLLNQRGFMSFEYSQMQAPATCVIGTVPNASWIKEQLDEYEQRTFVCKDGSFDFMTNVQAIATMMQKNGFLLNGEEQWYKDEIHVYTADYFSPITSTRVLKQTKNTYSVHHFASTWHNKSFKKKIKNFIFDKILGRNVTDKLVQLKRKMKKC